jgi:meso-butanediol dehydrogenase/(S,S)-butanediol dehydrogenase/diacetyl reductase
MTAMASSERFRGARALVTGAGSGIGRACAHRLAAEGAEVLAADIDLERVTAVAEEIVAGGRRAEPVELDVADPDSVAGLAALIQSPLEILVNNAGIGASGTIADTDDETWRRLFSVNVDGVFRCTRAVLPGMLRRGKGSVVNVASVAGLVGLTDRFAYCATKASVVGMTKAMALDFASSGVRFNCVCPGTVHTPWVESFATASGNPVEFRREMAARQPVGRMGESEEIAAAVAYLGSDEAAFMTGSCLVIDGGLSAGLAKPRQR